MLASYGVSKSVFRKRAARRRESIRARAAMVSLAVLAGVGVPSARAQRFPPLSPAGDPYPLLLREPGPLRLTGMEVGPDGGLELIDNLHAAWIASIRWGTPVDRLEFGTRPVAWYGAAGRVGGRPVAPAHAEFEIHRWTVSDGLPALKVRSVAQTPDGFLWVGTVDGLARFDGITFKVFSEANTAALRENGSVVRALAVDGRGRLWGGTMRGMFCLLDGRFVGFPGQEAVRGRPVNDLCASRKGGVWAALGDGLIRVDPDATEVMEIPAEAEVSTVIEGAGGELFFSVGPVVYRADPAGAPRRLALPWPVIPEAWDEARSWRIFDLWIADAGKLWIGTASGLWQFDPADEAAGLKATDPADLHLQVPQNAHIAAYGQDGLLATHRESPGLVLYRREDDGYRRQFLAGAETFSVIVDRAGSIWTGTREGLCSHRERPCVTFVTQGGASISDPTAIVESPDGGIWIAGPAQVFSWHGRELDYYTPAYGGGFRPALLAPMLERYPGTSRVPLPFLRGDAPGGDSAAGASGREDEAASLTVSVRLRDGSWLVGAGDGLFVLNPDDALARVAAVPERRVDALAELPGNAILLGIAGVGLCRMRDDRCEVLADEAATGKVNCLRPRATGEGVWVGTSRGMGIVVGDRFVRLDLGVLLNNLEIAGIVEDGLGHLWLNHPEGLSRLGLDVLERSAPDVSGPCEARHYGAEDGIAALNVAPGGVTALRASDGRLWFLKRHGVVMVDPTRLPNPSTPGVVIESLLADAVPIPRDGSAPGAPARAKGRIAFEFTTPSLHEAEETRLEYRLDGFDQDWRTADRSRRADYGRLAAGDYLFRVRARDGEGRWSGEEATLALRVTSPLWRTWPFGAAGAAAGTALLAAVMRWLLRTQRSRLKRETSRAVDSERRRIARDIHDHLGVLLANPGVPTGGGSSPAQGLRELIWQIHPANDRLPSVLDFIANLSSRYLEIAGIRLELELPPDPTDRAVSPEFRRNVAALLKEVLRNAAEHSKATVVSVRLAAFDKAIELLVSDNGCGFKAAELAPAGDACGWTGNGLRNLVHRSESLGGRCEINSRPGAGTSIRFVLPFGASPDPGKAPLPSSPSVPRRNES